ncbi:cryptochrome/photolyase family protein [Colwellia sp. UCD-KL20]|uniref:cryptochrome/photolyase family protein n=1 Tax=Colwellia sp. UCD-KL20 TaxID=1917165 RepID=UPI0009702EE3|nr:cryptochrome/photolyase family protein [Colwellia sp. UCD-KL20]
MKQGYQRLRLILGDQLNASHSWFQEKSSDTLYLIAELHQEATYTKHHIQKVCAFFAAMEAFARALKSADHQVYYMTLDDTQKYKDLPDLLSTLIKEYQITRFEYQLPDEFRLREQLAEFSSTLSIESHYCESEHFYLSDKELPKHFKQGKKHRLESFYRKLRCQFNVLMDNDTPMGGQWNYDTANRNKLKKSDLAEVPTPLMFSNDVTEILQRIEKHNIPTIGTASSSLLWPITRVQANELLRFFCLTCLPRFGQFQDAMTEKLKQVGEEQGWSLYHSRLSFALNCKILSPKHVVNTAIHYYFESKGKINLAQIEGFVRQIVGWREFVRGIYWANMPDYANANYLQASRTLPKWFWSGETKMNCLHHAIKQSLDFSYAHHIQRLMVTGNFCLVAGISPSNVDDWYLGIYIDAIEWVEMPNTRGMSQFADGGIVGSKAYAASGNYIKKMSDYCTGCHYNVSKIEGDDACPFNSMYWHFMDRHQNDFVKNPRTSMVYSNWQKKTSEQQGRILSQAQYYLDNLNSL